MDADAYLKKYHRGKIIKKLKIIVLLSIVVLIIAAVAADIMIRPIVKRSINARLHKILVTDINNIVLQNLESNECGYDDIIEISYDSEGNIKGMSANMMNVTLLKTHLVSATADYLLKQAQINHSIALGTLTGNEFLAGRGPLINFRIERATVVNAEIISDFSACGINQTLHSISIRLSVNAAAIVKGFNTPVDVITDVPITQTVIVGEVPQRYVNNPDMVLG